MIKKLCLTLFTIFLVTGCGESPEEKQKREIQDARTEAKASKAAAKVACDALQIRVDELNAEHGNWNKVPDADKKSIKDDYKANTGGRCTLIGNEESF